MASEAPFLHCRQCGKRYRSDKIVEHDLNCGKDANSSDSYTNLPEPELVGRRVSTATLPNINSGLNQIRDRPGSYDNVYDPTLEIRRSSSIMKQSLDFLGSRESIQEIERAAKDLPQGKVMEKKAYLERYNSGVMLKDTEDSVTGLERLMKSKLRISNPMSLEETPLKLSGSFHLEDSPVDYSYYENHRKSLIPCRFCERKFVPDRLQTHEKSCIERPKRMEYITPKKKV